LNVLAGMRSPAVRHDFGEAPKPDTCLLCDRAEGFCRVSESPLIFMAMIFSIGLRKFKISLIKISILFGSFSLCSYNFRLARFRTFSQYLFQFYSKTPFVAVIKQIENSLPHK